MGFVELLGPVRFHKIWKSFAHCVLKYSSCPPRPLWELQICTDLLDVHSQTPLCPLQPPKLQPGNFLRLQTRHPRFLSVSRHRVTVQPCLVPRVFKAGASCILCGSGTVSHGRVSTDPLPPAWPYLERVLLLNPLSWFLPFKVPEDLEHYRGAQAILGSPLDPALAPSLPLGDPPVMLCSCHLSMASLQESSHHSAPPAPQHRRDGMLTVAGTCSLALSPSSSCFNRRSDFIVTRLSLLNGPLNGPRRLCVQFRAHPQPFPSTPHPAPIISWARAVAPASILCAAPAPAPRSASALQGVLVHPPRASPQTLSAAESQPLCHPQGVCVLPGDPSAGHARPHPTFPEARPSLAPHVGGRQQVAALPTRPSAPQLSLLTPRALVTPTYTCGSSWSPRMPALCEQGAPPPRRP